MLGAGVDFFSVFFCGELAEDPWTVWVGGPEQPPRVARSTFDAGMMMEAIAADAVSPRNF